MIIGKTVHHFPELHITHPKIMADGSCVFHKADQTRPNQIRPFRANKKAAFRLTDVTRKYKVGEGDFYALKEELKTMQE